jgi:hypothetical protein
MRGALSDVGSATLDDVVGSKGDGKTRDALGHERLHLRRASQVVDGPT